VQQEKTQPKKINAARSSVPDNVSKLEYGEDVSQDKQFHTADDLKLWYAFRLIGKDGKAIASQKKVDVPLHSIIVDVSKCYSDSCNTDKSLNHMKCNHVGIVMEILSKKKVGSSLQSCVVGASNPNVEADVGIGKEHQR